MNDFNIDELAKFICMGKHSDLPCHEWCKEKCEFREKAKAISEAGYQKIIWHKVADGDLPTGEMKDYLCYFIFNKSDFYEIYTYHNNAFCFFDSESGDWVKRDVIAWMEIPKYEGEE